MGPFTPAKRGDKFRDVFTSKFHNEVTKLIGATTGSNLPTFSQEESDIALATINTDVGGSISPFQAVLIEQPIFEYNTNVNTEIPKNTIRVSPMSAYALGTHGAIPNWGIALDFINGTDDGRVLLNGACWLELTSTIPASNRSLYRAIDYRLGTQVFDMAGRAEIIGSLASGKSHAMVHLARQTTKSIHGITTGGGISTDSSGLIFYRKRNSSGWETTTVTFTAFNPSTSFNIPGGKRVICNWIDNEWVVVWADCTA